MLNHQSRMLKWLLLLTWACWPGCQTPGEGGPVVERLPDIGPVASQETRLPAPQPVISNANQPEWEDVARLATLPDAAPPVVWVEHPVPSAPLAAPAPLALIGYEAATDDGVGGGQAGPPLATGFPGADFSTGENDAAPGVVEINFLSALSLASGQNPEILFADARVRESFAQLQAARALWLPSLRAGVNWNKHEGRLQEVGGLVQDVSRANLYSGLGAAAVGAGSPAVPGIVAQFHTADSAFQPRIAAFRAAAQQSSARALTNDTLLEVALAYLELLTALQQRSIATETLENAQRLAELTRSFAQSGQGSQADADRALAELSLRRNEVLRSEERYEVAGARLTQLLGMDAQLQLLPEETQLVPLELVSLATPRQELVATGLANRPELAESRNLVCAAVNRLRREAYAPLMPSVLLGASYGGFGGGTGGEIDNFGDRFDVDAVAYWELRNLGFGERAARSEASARLDQAELREIAVMDRVAREITEAHAQVLARARQIEIAQAGIQAAQDSYRRNVDRIRGAQGLPIETLQSVQALDQARREYLRSVSDYDQAQFRLYRALGWPGMPSLN